MLRLTNVKLLPGTKKVILMDFDFYYNPASATWNNLQRKYFKEMKWKNLELKTVHVSVLCNYFHVCLNICQVALGNEVNLCGIFSG